jgi:pimeloyl-ACP methyl ester carboxylesterase
MRVYFEDIGGATTRYFRAGRGPAVLLLHGVGMTADSWCRVIEPLARDFDVIAPDLLDNGLTAAGTYRSGPPHGPMLDHLEALIAHLGLKDIVLIGSSFGAALSVLLYHRAPKLFSALVLVSSGSTFKTAEELVAMYKQAAANGGKAFADPSIETCRSRLANLFHDASRIPPELLLMQLTPMALPQARAAYERRMTGMMDLEAMRPYAIGDRLTSLSLPTLAVWGKQDPRGDFAKAAQVFGALPHVRLEAIEGCGHLPHLEQSERFIELVRAFLSDALEMDNERRQEER